MQFSAQQIAGWDQDQPPPTARYPASDKDSPDAIIALVVATSEHTSVLTSVHTSASIPTAAENTERIYAAMKKKQQTASSTPIPEEPRGVVRLPLELPPALAHRLNLAMAKKFPGANRSFVLRHLIEQFCKEAGV